MPLVLPGPQHRHRRQALDPGAAQQLQQQRLGLVVEMMGRQQHRLRAQRARDRRVAGTSRGRLRTLAGRRTRIHDEAGEFDAECIADLTAMNGPITGRRLQAMIDVYCPERRRQFGAQHGERVQQHGRVEPATEPDPVGRRSRQFADDEWQQLLRTERPVSGRRHRTTSVARSAARAGDRPADRPHRRAPPTAPSSGCGRRHPDRGALHRAARERCRRSV